MSEQFLHGPDVVAVIQQMSGETIAQGATTSEFVQPHYLGRFSDRFLRAALSQVMATCETGAGICGEVAGWEDVLPAPSAGILIFEIGGQIDGAVAFFEILLVDSVDAPDVFLERLDEAIGKHCDVVVQAFASAHGDLTVAKVEVNDPQAQALDQPEAGAVQQTDDESSLVGAGQGLEQHPDLLPGEDGGHSLLGPFGADVVDRALELFFEHLEVEEQEGAESLVLRGGGHILVHGQVGEKGLNFRGIHLFGMSFVVEQDVAFDPPDISLLGVNGVVLGA